MSVAGPTVPSTIPPQCCAIPFILNGNVYYNCAVNETELGCFYEDGTWKLCEQPAGKSSRE